MRVPTNDVFTTKTLSHTSGINSMKPVGQKYQNKLKEIAARTGIDFARYRDPVLVEKLGNLLTIQFYAIKAISIPVLLLLLIHWGIAAYAFITSKNVAGIVIGLGGIIPSIVVGILTGIVVLMGTIKNDVKQLFSLSIDTIRTILADTNSEIQRSVHSVSECQSNLPKLSDLLQGVIFGIILPTLQQIIVSKFKIVRRPLEYLFNTTIVAVANSTLAVLDERTNNSVNNHSEKIAVVTTKVSKISDETANSINTSFDMAVKKLEAVKNVIDLKIESAGSKVIAPIKLLMVIGLMITVIVLVTCIKFLF
ncbi:hypothetical protein Ppro_1905 [Pelobacter propionicus DSM 2379]|uniref:Uncharacterized protein n=2 Tax=Pelobacter propionicus TaxID=29543 RepID=A1AQ95_PELPD|nr:hypothetical protein Ppro_1905 [Pelobacter propionicus DSM 2379]